MESSSLMRWGGLAAMLLSGLFVLGSFLEFYLQLITQRSAPRALVVGPIVALSLALLVGMAGFHALQKGNYGRIGRAGFYTVVVALAAVWLGLGPYFFAYVMSSGILALVLAGLLGLLVGFVLYGAATLQADVLPRWCGIAFIGALPVTVALAFISPLGQSGALFVFGLVWLALGYTLWTRSSAPTQQPQRVR